jgi:hypothetical protein
MISSVLGPQAVIGTTFAVESSICRRRIDNPF